MSKTKIDLSKLRMRSADFDDMMRRALGAPPPPVEKKIPKEKPPKVKKTPKQ